MKNSINYLIVLFFIVILGGCSKIPPAENTKDESETALQYDVSTFNGGETIHYLFRKGAGFISVTTQSDCPECGIAVSGNFRYLDSFPKEASIPGLSQTIILDRESNVQN
ncbi:MAG: hypothetical protein ACI83D_000652, partial [Planctomycetota bacterium]